MIVMKSELDPYLDGDADLIPLHIWNKQTVKKGKIIKRGKTPIYGDWTIRPKDVQDTLNQAEQGRNVGYRLSETDLIVDVDPRNFADGENSLKKLCKVLGIKDLTDHYPTVNTGGGGFHFYMLKPKSLHIRGTLEDYPGVEFKSKGTQVVSAGSKHPSGEYYEWDPFCDIAFKDRKMAPKSLLKLLERPEVEQKGQYEVITPKQLEKLLEQLDITEFDSNDTWFPLLCASHHATNGTGIEEFIEWCVGDPKYQDDDQTIRSRWDSLGGKKLNYTINTLYKIVLSYGGTTSVTSASEDFSSIEDEQVDEDDSLDLSDVMGTKKSKQSMLKGVAVNLANSLHSSSSDEEIVKAIRAMLQASVVERARAEKIICSKVGLNKTALNSIIATIKEDLIEDLGRVIAAKTIETQYYEGKGLIHIGQFWAYNGKYWKPVTIESVGNKVLHTLDKIRDTIDIVVKDNTIKTEAVSLIASLTSKDEDPLGLRKEPKPIINCQNGELWVGDDGVPKLKPHRPSSNLLQVLDVEYSPGAECPIFDKAIRKTFSNFEDCEDMVRHFEEYIGYCIHPVKHKPYWWLFKGPGGDGKSTLMEIISALLGDAVLPDSIEKFRTNGDNHATASLVGKLLMYDDDMNSNTMLPDGPLKTISSRGDLTANPKGKDTFKFRKVCTVTMLSNGYPKTRAVDRGFRRRAMVIPFNNAFHDKDGIYNLAEQIVNTELAGVLNRALQGLQRLRKRGDFKVPLSCVTAVDDWLNEANNVVNFFNTYVERTKKNTDRISVTDMYTHYNSFCHEHGITKIETKSNMVNSLKDIEIIYDKDIGGNRRGFRFVKFLDSVIEDFDDL